MRRKVEATWLDGDHMRSMAKSVCDGSGEGECRCDHCIVGFKSLGTLYIYHPNPLLILKSPPLFKYIK